MAESNNQYPKDVINLYAPIEVKFSPGKGLGLFAKEFIPKGTQFGYMKEVLLNFFL